MRKESSSRAALLAAGDSGRGILTTHVGQKAQIPAQERGRSHNGSAFAKETLLRSAKVMSLLATCVLFAVCYSQFYLQACKDNPPEVVFPAACVIYLLLAIYFIRVYHAYQVGISRISELVYSQSLANFMSAGILYLLQALLIGALANPLPLILLVLVQSLLNVFWSYLANALYLRLYPPVKTIILYHRETELLKLRQIKDFSMKFDVRQCRKDPVDNPLLFQELEEHAAVFLLGIDVELRNKIAEYCLKSKRNAYIVPSASDIILTGAKLLESYQIPIYRIGRSSPTPEYAVLKRLFDVVLSFSGIVLSSPVMLVTALAIKLTDGGPVFYRQERLTRNGKCFYIWKFRSMRVDAEKDGVARLASEHDNRITPVGKVIRSARIDELPQLFNILRGHMSLVGPRPERPEIAAEYEKSIPAFSLRLQVKAGLTGYAQVYGRYDSTPQDKLNMDLMYINNTSILEDIRLLFATLKILFLEESTTGLKNGQMHAMQEEEEEWMKRNSA